MNIDKKSKKIEIYPNTVGQRTPTELQEELRKAQNEITELKKRLIQYEEKTSDSSTMKKGTPPTVNRSIIPQTKDQQILEEVFNKQKNEIDSLIDHLTQRIEQIRLPYEKIKAECIKADSAFQLIREDVNTGANRLLDTICIKKDKGDAFKKVKHIKDFLDEVDINNNRDVVINNGKLQTIKDGFSKFIKNGRIVKNITNELIGSGDKIKKELSLLIQKIEKDEQCQQYLTELKTKTISTKTLNEQKKLQSSLANEAKEQSSRLAKRNITHFSPEVKANLALADSLFSLIKEKIEIIVKLYSKQFFKVINNLDFQASNVFDEKDMKMLAHLGHFKDQFDALTSKFQESRLNYANNPDSQGNDGLTNKQRFKKIQGELNSFLFQITPNKEALSQKLKKLSIELPIEPIEENIKEIIVKPVRIYIPSKENHYKDLFLKIIKTINDKFMDKLMLIDSSKLMKYVYKLIAVIVLICIVPLVLLLLTVLFIVALLGMVFMIYNPFLTLEVLGGMSALVIAYKQGMFTNALNLFSRQSYTPDIETGIDILYKEVSIEYIQNKKKEEAKEVNKKIQVYSRTRIS